jgi:L-threonylcarbamoyladenylate synthase
MKTWIVKIENEKIDIKKIKKAAELLKKGKLVAFPTETVYGLGANALDPKAVEKIFKAKKRPTDNPIIVHVSDKEMVNKLVQKIPNKALLLMDKFWPGPLTLVMKKSNLVPDIVTSGLNTVAIRMPSHEIAFLLIKESGVPIAAPSANLAGKPSPTIPEDVIQDLDGRVDAIIDAGESDIGVESTVLDLTTKIPTLLRPGGITLEQLESILGKVELHPIIKAKRETKDYTPKSPGMKYRHYAPEAEVIVVEGNSDEVRKEVIDLIKYYKTLERRIGVMTVSKKHKYDCSMVKFIGDDLKDIAKNLFTALRSFDKKNIDVIIAEGVEEKGLGLAVMNRLRKASGYNIIKV